jgi:hypothetical protein
MFDDIGSRWYRGGLNTQKRWSDSIILERDNANKVLTTWLSFFLLHEQRRLAFQAVALIAV